MHLAMVELQRICRHAPRGTTTLLRLDHRPRENPRRPPDSTLRTTTTPLQDEEETRTAKAAVRATHSMAAFTRRSIRCAKMPSNRVPRRLGGGSDEVRVWCAPQRLLDSAQTRQGGDFRKNRRGGLNGVHLFVTPAGLPSSHVCGTRFIGQAPKGLRTNRKYGVCLLRPRPLRPQPAKRPFPEKNRR
jgi:hypothetical protein